MMDLEALSRSDLISLIVGFRSELAILKENYDLVSSQLKEVGSELVNPKAELAEAKVKLARALTELSETKAELFRLKKPPKNSRNSSIPPSKDENAPKKNQSLRRTSGKKRGGQPGHKGNTLHLVSNPGEIEDHIPCYCTSCGADLAGIEAILTERRQVVDIPPIHPVYTEHRSYTRRCTCGQHIKGSFPPDVRNRIQYGWRITALVAYLSVRQYIPFNRIKELCKDVFALNISEGGIERLLERFKAKSGLVYEKIRARISTSKVAGADETGCKVNGEKWWIWVWQDLLNTFIVVSKSRGFDSIEKLFPSGLPLSILVSDCWSAHLKTQAKIHQLCMAHLLRTLNYLIQLNKSSWAKKIKELFCLAIEYKKQLKEHDYLGPMPKRDEIEKRLDELLNYSMENEHKEIRTFQKRLIKYRNYLFPFLYYHAVPSDNNASERAIRNVKVKMKVSNQFRSENGAQTFAIIRSVIDTCRKRGNNIMDSLSMIAQLGWCR